MINPIVTVKHVNPQWGYSVRIDPPKFWKAVHEAMIVEYNYSSTDNAKNQALMLQLARGPSFTIDQIRKLRLATNLDGNPVNDFFDPTDFAQCVTAEMRKHTDPAARDYFFSIKALQDAGIIPATAPPAEKKK